LLAADPGVVGKLEKQLKAANTRIKTLRTDLYEARKAATSPYARRTSGPCGVPCIPTANRTQRARRSSRRRRRSSVG
jgi:hypothetical protein